MQTNYTTIQEALKRTRNKKKYQSEGGEWPPSGIWRPREGDCCCCCSCLSSSWGSRFVVQITIRSPGGHDTFVRYRISGYYSWATQGREKHSSGLGGSLLARDGDRGACWVGVGQQWKHSPLLKIPHNPTVGPCPPGPFHPWVLSLFHPFTPRCKNIVHMQVKCCFLFLSGSLVALSWPQNHVKMQVFLLASRKTL